MTTGLKVGAQTPEEIAAAQADDDLELVSGPRWRMTSNKFGQDLPGLEIPSIECSQPPYQKGTIRYETGEPITTTINLLDWSTANDRCGGRSRRHVAARLQRRLDQRPGTAEDSAPRPGVRSRRRRRHGAPTPTPTATASPALGTTLTDGFDVSFYVKGDIKPPRSTTSN